MTKLDRVDDKQAIISHVHGLFDAYLRKDREAIRRGHTGDWHGFQVMSRRLVRGIDEYMKAAEEVLVRLKATRYEMLEMDVQVLGDVALVYYVARDFLKEADGSERTILLRALDVYRREPEGWNQCGSNICTMADE